MGGVIWKDRGWGWVVSDGRTEDGNGDEEGNGHGLIEELFQHSPRRSWENNKNFGRIFSLPCRNSNRPSSK